MKKQKYIPVRPCCSRRVGGAGGGTTGGVAARSGTNQGSRFSVTIKKEKN